MELDRYDRMILRVLQENARISNQDLADRIGLSPSPCLRRVRALEEAGILTRPSVSSASNRKSYLCPKCSNAC